MNSVLRRNLVRLQCSLKKDLNRSTGNCVFTRKLNIGVQGAGYGGGQPKSGLIYGPELIRRSGFIQFLVDEVGHDIKDYGDLTFDETRDKSPTIVEGCVPLNNVGSISRANFQIYESTRKILSDNRVPLTLGGDHSISIGTLAAVSEKCQEDIGILWVDAHADLNTPYTTNSGNLHGLPMGFHVKELAHDFKCLAAQFNWLVPRIPAKNIAYIGLREIGGRFNPKAQRENIKRLGIKTYTMGDVDRLGICEVTKQALDHVSLGGRRPVHLSFDVDSMDDFEIGMCTGTSVVGGLTLREALTLLEMCHGHLVSADFVEVNPLLGDPTSRQRTEDICKHLLGAMWGYRRAGL